MSEPILTVLKFFLLALIWLFFLRVLRAQWVDLRSRDTGPAVPPPAPTIRPAPQSAPAPTLAPAAAPTSAVTSGRYGVRVVEGPDHAGASFPVEREITVGRATGADIALPGDSFTSSRHARLWVDAGRLWVEDLGSTNGTQVNGQPISSATGLKPGDRVQVGRTVLEVSAA